MQSTLYFRFKTRTYHKGLLWLEYQDPAETPPEALKPENVERGRTNGGVSALEALDFPQTAVCEDEEVEAVRRAYFKWRYGTPRRPSKVVEMDPNDIDELEPKAKRKFARLLVGLGGSGAREWEKYLEDFDDDEDDEDYQEIEVPGLETVAGSKQGPAGNEQGPAGNDPSDNLAKLTVAQLRKAIKEAGEEPAGNAKSDLIDQLRKIRNKE